MKNILGIDIGGTKCAITYGRQEEDRVEIVDKAYFHTADVTRTINEIKASVAEVMQRNSLTAGNTAAIGISCGGPLDSAKGIVMSPPNLPGWDGIPIVDIIREEFGIPTAIHNDANACALAEWKFGAGRGSRNMVFLTFGTGFGAGLILDGRLYSGTSDMAGEIGHVRCEEDGPVGYGKAGSFEGFCSGGGIAQLGKRLGLPPDMTAKEIADGAYAGDETCREVYRISGEKLGKMLSILIDLLNPEAVVIGGVFARSSDLLLPYAEEVVKREALSYSREVCRILPVGLGEFVGDYSALALARFA